MNKNNVIGDFINKLSIQKVNSQTENIYSDDNFILNFITKTNLLNYLTQMKGLNPDTIFVGEAPGHKGCKLTGIPFTSEFVLSKTNKFGLFGYSQNLEQPQNPQKEATATMIWELFEKHNFCPLLWNAYPFYPFNEKTGKSNRKPNLTELLIGEKYILQLIDIFKIKKVVAVGKLAEKTLLKLNLQPFVIPHPSFGNKNKFENKLIEFINQKI